jgi:NAD(P)H dehydrogenase (quinone)
MKFLLVHAHLEQKSFNSALTNHAVVVLREAGHEVCVSNLYEMNFNPVSSRENFTTVADADFFKQQREEAYATDNDGFAPEVLTELEKVEWCDVLIFQFPLWWFSVPAILKGWVDRVFAYKRVYARGHLYSEGAFAGKKALISVTTGGPETNYSPLGMNGEMDKILFPIQHGMLAFVGFDVLPPFLSYSVAHISDAERQEMLDAWADRLRTVATTEPLGWAPKITEVDETGQDILPRFLTHFTIITEPPADVLQAENAMTARLKAQSILQSLHLAEDRRQGWLTLRAASLEDVERILQSLPVYPYLQFETTRLK